MTENLIVMTPAISMAPQKDISLRNVSIKMVRGGYVDWGFPHPSP